MVNVHLLPRAQTEDYTRFSTALSVLEGAHASLTVNSTDLADLLGGAIPSNGAFVRVSVVDAPYEAKVALKSLVISEAICKNMSSTLGDGLDGVS